MRYRLTSKLTIHLPDDFHRDLEDSPWRSGVDRSVRGRTDGAIWKPEVSVIEQIECFKSSLKSQSLDQRDILEEGGIHILDARRTDDVPGRIAIFPNAGLNK
jgi:hypothetical protein